MATMSQVQKDFVRGYSDHEGERIYFESVGHGPALVLCHGLGGNHAIWWQQIGPLSEQFQVVTWDQRGFGNSSRSTGQIGPTPAVGDLVHLLDHLGIAQAHVVGQSMGGWVAMGTAVTHPDRVRSLVLTDTLAGVYTPQIEAVVQESIAANAAALRGDVFGEHPALSDPFVKTNPAVALLYQEISSFGDKPGDVEMFELLSKTRWPLNLVTELPVPALFLVGSEDWLCPPSAVKLVAEQLANAHFEVVPGCGHSPYFEEPGTWNRLVLAFVRTH
jgi:3-oxoadipate enol-lactonase